MRSILLHGVIAVCLIPTAVYGEIEVPSRLTRNEARGLLLEHNPALKAATVRIDVERADLISASRRPNPELSFSSEGLNFRSETASSWPDEQEFSLSLRYRIETSGKREKRTDVEQFDIQISEMEMNELTRHLLFQMDRRYFQVVFAQENLDLAQVMLEDFRSILRLNRLRYENGEISGGELRRVEAEQYRFLEDVIAAEVALENARDNLISLLGSDRFGTVFTATDSLKESAIEPVPELLPAKLRETAVRSRSDLMVARANLRQAAAGIELEKALSRPDFIPFIGYRRDFGANGLIAGIQIPLPVFDRNEGGVARLTAQEKLRQWELKEKQILVSKEIQLAINELRGHQRRVGLLEGEYLSKSRQARDIADSAYRLGGISLIEFLDAQRTFRETARRLNRALFDLRVSEARLERSVGRKP